MDGNAELAERQRRALDRLKPLALSLQLYLAGGTAVACHLGHRVSLDLDLFSQKGTLDLESVRALLVEFPGVDITSMTDAALRLRIDGVPVDIVRYPFEPLRPPSMGPGEFPTASLEDLATMKLSAVARRGIRRDFWDLFEILRRDFFTLTQALEAYRIRYGVKQSDVYHVLRALNYFDDAEADPLLPDGMTVAKWAEIKAWFTAEVPRALEHELNQV